MLARDAAKRRCANNAIETLTLSAADTYALQEAITPRHKCSPTMAVNGVLGGAECPDSLGRGIPIGDIDTAITTAWGAVYCGGC